MGEDCRASWNVLRQAQDEAEGGARRLRSSSFTASEASQAVLRPDRFDLVVACELAAFGFREGRIESGLLVGGELQRRWVVARQLEKNAGKRILGRRRKSTDGLQRAVEKFGHSRNIARIGPAEKGVALRAGAVDNVRTALDLQRPAVKKPSPILVKRYGGDRLYDTVGCRYVTIANLREWSNRAIAFVVIDSRTGEDITRILAG